jgi:serine protease Do
LNRLARKFFGTSRLNYGAHRLLKMKLNRYGSFLAAGLLSCPAFAIEAPSSSAPPPPAPSGRPAEARETFEEEPAPQPAPLNERRDPSPKSVVPAANSAYLGVGGYRAPEILAIHLGLKNGEGLVVGSLDPSGPAAAAGLAENDVITRADTAIITSREDLTRAVQAKKPGDKITIDFIHEGKPDRRDIVLTNRPQGPVAGMPQQPNAQLDRMLRNLPQEQADRIRESIEQSLRGGGIEPFQNESIPQMEDAIDEMRKRAEKMFEGMKDPSEAQSNFSSASSIRLLDDQGSVEIQSRNGGTEVRVLDKQGKEVWSGPWNSEQDKSAAPKEVRDRVERLNFDMDSGSNGLRLRMGPRIDRR